MKVTQVCPILCDPVGCSLPGSSVHGNLQPELAWVAVPFSRGSFQPRSPTLQVDSLLSESPGKPKNTRVGSLSLLQWIFHTQESNQSLLHCRQILYKLSNLPVLKTKTKTPKPGTEKTNRGTFLLSSVGSKVPWGSSVAGLA